MAQHDYIIANQSGAAFRNDLNVALAAVATNNSPDTGTAAPSTTYRYQWWADHGNGLLKIRNAANSGWITVGTLGSANLGLLASGNIVDADINASAAIVGTKIVEGTTSVRGTLQLTNSTTSTNTTTAATPANVKTAVDNAASAQSTANAALSKAGGTMTGDVTFTTAQPRVARAWINYNATGTQSIRASFNVASITDLGGSGSTRITFTNAMGDGNYAVAGAAHTTSSGAAIVRPQVLNTGSVDIQTENSAGVDIDASIVGVAIFR